MLTFGTEVERRLVVIVLIHLLLCSVLAVIASAGAATLEFTYSAWARQARYMPVITEAFRNVYRWGWGIPIGLALWSIVLVWKPACKLGALLLLAGTEVVLIVGWCFFALLSFYLGNQSFLAQ